MTMYRDHIVSTLGYKLPDVSSAGELIAMAKTIKVPAWEAQRGWRTDPPFPGLTEAPEEGKGSWRMICASRLFVGDEESAVIFMTLVSGKTATVAINAARWVIPERYLPLSAR